MSQLIDCLTVNHNYKILENKNDQITEDEASNSDIWEDGTMKILH